MLLPGAPSDDVVDMTARDAIPNAQDRWADSVAIGHSDRPHIADGESRSRVRLTPAIGMRSTLPQALGLRRQDVAAALGAHISEVVPVGPEPEMIGSDAPSVVAMMEDKEAVRDWAEVQFPRDAMGIESDPSTVAIADAQNAIAVARSGGPFPAFVALVHLGPEPPFHPFHEVSIP